jgi:hypothetical protein
MSASPSSKRVSWMASEWALRRRARLMCGSSGSLAGSSSSSESASDSASDSLSSSELYGDGGSALSGGGGSEPVSESGSMALELNGVGGSERGVASNLKA